MASPLYALVDGNNFYVSCERVFRPSLNGKTTLEMFLLTLSQGQRLTLRSLLHYLWDQAELTHWKPGFVGRRSWTTVRRHLLRAAEYKVVRGHPLLASLYIPETFSVERPAPLARNLR